MAQEIEINTGSLNRDIESMQTHLDKITGDLSKMYDAVALLDKMWDGPANDAFRQQFMSDKEQMQDVCDTIQKIIDCMMFASKEYDTCEADVHNLVASIRI